jgi:type II secretory pathway pseudopilin PulG
MGKARRGSAGFTLAEALAGMLFLAIVIPATVEGFLVANRAGVLAERNRMAAQLADQKLSGMVLSEEWRDSDEEGDFGEDYPGFRWVLSDEAWGEDTMRLVSVEVFFTVQGREYSIRLSTLAKESET